MKDLDGIDMTKEEALVKYPFLKDISKQSLREFLAELVMLFITGKKDLIAALMVVARDEED